MTTYKIEYDNAELQKLANQFAKGMTTAAFPNTDAAFQRAAIKIRQMWMGYLDGSVQLPGVNNPDKVTSAMIRSIKIKDNTTDSVFSQTVYTDNRQLEQLNKGSKEVEYDMKKTHPYGKKSRVTQSGKNKGVPYLIIPFRWGTPNKNGTKRGHFNNVIPQANYETAVKGLAISRVNELKKYFEANAKGEKIERQGYNWAKNGRLTDDQAWDDRSVGMVRMKDVTGSTYFTFRIISAKSPANSWIYHKDAKQALNYLAALEQAARPEVEKMIREGLKADEEFYRNTK
jgi:hypothetical protein